MLLRTCIVPGKGVKYWNLQGDAPGGWASCFTPLREGDYSVSTGTLVLLQTGPVEIYSTWKGTHTIERGEKAGTLVWYTPPFVPPLDLTVLPAPASLHGVYNQVKLLKLPAFLSSRPADRVLFLTGVIIWLLLLFPPLAQRVSQHT